VRAAFVGSRRPGQDRFIEPTRQLDAESIEDAAHALDRDPVVLVPFVARYLRLVNAESLGELALGDAECDAQGDEHPPEPVKVRELTHISALQALVALDFFCQLHVERTKRIEGALHFVRRKLHRLEPGFMIGEALGRRTASWYSVSLRIMVLSES
jgi:hypothetical protein